LSPPNSICSCERKQQGPRHAGRRQQQQQEDDLRNQHQERRTHFFLRGKEADLDKGAQEIEQRQRKGTSRGGRKKNDRRKEPVGLFIEKPNCNQGLKLNYRSVIHSTSESSM
jgi:hypothetical protein